MRTTGPAMPSGPSLVGRDQELAAVQACLNGALSGKLKAFNSGNYAAWSADWSEALKDAIREKDFLSFREQAIATAGRYVSIAGSDVRSRRDPGRGRIPAARELKHTSPWEMAGQSWPAIFPCAWDWAV
jgi:hypothetical protein